MTINEMAEVWLAVDSNFNRLPIEEKVGLRRRFEKIPEEVTRSFASQWVEARRDGKLKDMTARRLAKGYESGK